MLRDIASRSAAETLFLSPVHAEKYLDAARGALQYAASHRDRLPPDLFLASFDNPEFAAVAGIPGLSIAQPIDEIGRRAAEILLERIRNEALGPYRIERLPTHIVFNGGPQWLT